MKIEQVVKINARSLQKDFPFREIEYVDISSVGTGILNEPPSNLALSEAPSRARRLVRSGDTIISTVRPNRRSFFYLKNPKENTVVSTGFAVLTPTPQVDSRYLYCWITRPEFSEYLSAHAKGAAYPAVAPEDIGRAHIALPPLSVQRRIAAILSAYDDLIENNLRRIKILEEMARALYREWFVEFKFPGHVTLSRVASVLGPIPEGWEVRKLGAILQLNYGKALKSAKRTDGSVPVFGSSGIVGHHELSLVKGPGIIVGRKGNVGSVFWSPDDFYPIDTVYFVTSSLPLRFLFHDLQTKNFINNDAAVPGLNRNQAYSLETIVPPSVVLEHFCRITNAFDQQALILRKQCVSLRQTRDLLLPQLLSEEGHLR